MKIVYNCPKCYKLNKVKERASNRYKLYEKIGGELDVKCSHCGQESKIHINRVYAKVDPVVLSVVILALSSASFFIGKYLLQTYWVDNPFADLKGVEVAFVGAAIPLVILSIAIPSLNKRANYFNSYRL